MIARTRILELAAKADVDERTLKRILEGGEARSKSAKRAQAILRAEGLLFPRRNPESRSPASAAATLARVAAART
jgi:hypothetical protein